LTQKKRVKIKGMGLEENGSSKVKVSISVFTVNCFSKKQSEDA
jgi:hypothetical protein